MKANITNTNRRPRIAPIGPEEQEQLEVLGTIITQIWGVKRQLVNSLLFKYTYIFLLLIYTPSFYSSRIYCNVINFSMNKALQGIARY